MKLTLNKSWKLCLEQWGSIFRRKKNGSKSDVGVLKDEWCRKNGYKIQNSCFFCGYDEQRRDTCEFCPGRKVDKTFHCKNKEYDFYNKPFDFFAELKRLNKIRLGKKVKK